MMTIIPNKDQTIALEKTEAWWKKKPKQVWEIAGAAGTGKTTIVYLLMEKMGLSQENVLFTAYVGKATLALSLKGTPAQTIHSTIYDMVYVPKRDTDNNIVTVNDKPVMIPTFVKKTKLDEKIQLIVVDEGSMVNEKIGLDLLSFGLPILVLGDIFQLPPIFGESFFLRHPDVLLTEPMRQSLDSPIIFLSQLARTGKKIPPGRYGNSFVIDKSIVSDKMLMKTSITICGTNKTREEINNYVRYEILKKTKPLPSIGEKIICRQNNWNESLRDNIFLINGLVGYVEDIHLETFNKQSIDIDFRPEFFEYDRFENIPMDVKHIITPYKDRSNSRSFYNKFEYAYAITAHLAQGSQYENVLVFNERTGTRDYYNRWLYTAITRASNSIILAL